MESERFKIPQIKSLKEVLEDNVGGKKQIKIRFKISTLIT